MCITVPGSNSVILIPLQKEPNANHGLPLASMTYILQVRHLACIQDGMQDTYQFRIDSIVVVTACSLDDKAIITP